VAQRWLIGLAGAVIFCSCGLCALRLATKLYGIFCSAQTGHHYMELNREVLQILVDFLSPFMTTEQERRAWLFEALVGEPVLYRIDDCPEKR
jgi:hypothetical protein